jgi:hypothetical protein
MRLNATLRTAALRRVRGLLLADGDDERPNSMWLDEAAKWAIIAEALRPDPPEYTCNANPFG